MSVSLYVRRKRREKLEPLAKLFRRKIQKERRVTKEDAMKLKPVENVVILKVEVLPDELTEGLE